MKHACESCGQKYAIPDERVTGRFLRVRCQKCQGVMHVDGTHVVPGRVSIPPPVGRMAEPQPVRQWYYAAAGRPHGPYTRNDILALIELGEVRARTLLWRDGMDRWERINESVALEWAMAGVRTREGGNDPALYRAPTGLFERVPVALVHDGRAYFPDPTLHTGFTVLSEEARAYLDAVAAREARHQSNLRWQKHALHAAVFLGLTLLGAAGAWAATLM